MTITQLIVILISAAVTSNILLVKFMGMCSFLAISRNLRTAVGLGFAVLFVTTATAPINYLIDTHLLQPNGLGFLQFIIYIMVIAGFVQLVEMIIERFSPVLHINLGIYLPLITVNCAILGASLDQAKDLTELTVLSSTVYGFACGLGWMIVILLMAGIRSRLDSKSIPRPMRGLGITLVVTGLMAMAFMGFDGVDKKIKASAAEADKKAAAVKVVPVNLAPPASEPKGAKA